MEGGSQGSELSNSKPDDGVMDGESDTSSGSDVTVTALVTVTKQYQLVNGGARM